MQAQPRRPAIPTQQNRLTIALGVFAVWVLITLGGGWLQTGGTGSLDELVARQVGFQFVAAALFLFGVVVYLGWQRSVGLRSAEPASSWRLLWLPALFILAFLTFGALVGLPPTSVIIFVLINTLLVGVSEELMFRGVLFHGALTRMRIWPAIIVTCALFGLVHALNGFITGDFAAAFAQALAAGLSGLWLHAIRLRTRSLYPAMVIHGLWDFGVFMFGMAASGAAPSQAAPAPPNIFASLLSVLPLALYGLWLMRGVGTRERDELLA